MFILHIEKFRSHTVDVLCFSSVPVIPVLNVIDCSLKVLEYINHFSYLTLLKDLRKTHSELWYIFCISTCYPSCFIKWRFFNKPKACRKMLLMSSFTPNLFSLYTPTHLSLSPLHLSAPPHLSTSTCASPPPCNSMFKSYYIIRPQACVWGVFQETVQYFSVWWIMNRRDHTQLGGAFRSR